MPACCDTGVGSAEGSAAACATDACGGAACGGAAWSAGTGFSIDVIVCRLVGFIFGMFAILLEFAVKFGEPLCIHKRFENAPDFELILRAAQLAQKSHIDHAVDVPIDLVRQLGLI